MADENFLDDGDFPSGLTTAPFFGSGPYAPPPLGLDAATAAMASFCMLPWTSELPIPSGSAAATTTAHFDSALSSLVSSPAHASIGDDVAIGDLIGRLGSICSNTAASANNSCYSTPLSSPPRGAALAFRQGGCYPGAPPLDTGGRLSRVASSKSLGGAAPATMESPADAEIETPAKGGDGSGAARKRKASGKGKTAVSNASPKRSKLVSGNGNENDDDAAEEKEPEPVIKDYIHVRARRGQATDSHSLAERVRREKISERMKLLQSLVPGCNKITGKALMLDEIINYVQSLQRQVEFLSMKLSTMNPQLLDVDAAQHLRLSGKDMMMHHQTAMLGYPQAAAAFSYAEAAMHPTTMDSCISSSSFHHGGTEFGDWAAAAAQDLQSIIAHRHDHQQQPGHGFCGGQQEEETATVSHMKVEP